MEGTGSHKYVVQGSILLKSWPIEDTAWPELASIRSSERMDEGTHKPSSGKKKRVKASVVPVAIQVIYNHNRRQMNYDYCCYFS